MQNVLTSWVWGAVAVAELMHLSSCGRQNIGDKISNESHFTQINNGNITGNGGAVVACRNRSGALDTVEPLDTYEGRVVRGLIPNFAGTHGNADEIAQQLLARWDRLDSTRAAGFKHEAAAFKDNNVMLANTTLQKTEDYGPIFVPNNCNVEQAIVRRVPQVSTDKRFVVSKELWEKMSPQNQAAMITHEAIYHEGINRGHENSYFVRNLNEIMLAAKLEHMTKEDFARILFENRFDEYDDSRFRLRFFPKIFLTRDQAIKYCEKIGYGFQLWTYPLPSKEIGPAILTQILSPDASHLQYLWLNSAWNSVAFADHKFSYENVDPTKLQQFICQDANSNFRRPLKKP